MALAKNLLGAGIPDVAANLLGDNPAAAVTAAGTTTADATVLLLAQNFVLMTATGSDGVRLPGGTLLQRPYVITNNSASTGKVYPPSSGTFAGGSADAAISVPTRKTIICWRNGTTDWSYNLSA